MSKEEIKKIKIVKMVPDDVPMVFALEERVNPKHHWSKDSFYNELSNKLASYFSIKDEKKNILAYIGFWQIIEEAHVTNLAVDPDYRRNGFASILLLKTIEECYKNMVKFITLEVRESNTAAINLYEKFLFSSVGVRKNYYQDNGENALIMFTQNIWYDKFKNNFRNIKESINKAEYLYDE